MESVSSARWTAVVGRAVHTAVEAIGESADDREGLRVGGEALGGGPAGVHDSGVVAPAEAGADRGQGRARVLTGEVHGDLPRPGQARGAIGRQELVEREAERLGGE